MVNPTELFEEEFRRFVKSGHAVAVCNGTAALHIALLTVGVKRGQRVVTTPFTFPATANAILHMGAKPFFVDMERENYCINPEAVDSALKAYDDVSAVVVVHLFGKTSDLDHLTATCRENRIPLIEDCSQALGAKYEGRYVGTFGDVGTFSFYATKNLSTFEGGMVVTDRRDVAERARMIRNHGFNADGEMELLGFNYKMPWICAFLGWQRLKLHKPSILAELGRYGPEDGYYPQLVYEHQFYRENPQLWDKFDCPVAEEAARRVRERKWTS